MTASTVASDHALQRRNMVESQIRTSDVTEERLLNALLEVPRERFVPPAMAGLAYMGGPLQLAGKASRALIEPRTFAKLVQLADIEAISAVLDVGCATGYSSAVLARLAKSVVALECDSDLAAHATTVLGNLGADHVTVVTGDLAKGYVGLGPYDAILVEGLVAKVPQELLDQLAPGGRLVAIVPVEGVDRACLWQRFGGTVARAVHFDASAPELPGFAVVPGFVF